MAKKDGSKYLGTGTARHAASVMKGRGRSIDSIVNAAVRGPKSEKKKGKGKK